MGVLLALLYYDPALAGLYVTGNVVANNPGVLLLFLAAAAFLVVALSMAGLIACLCCLCCAVNDRRKESMYLK